MRVGAFCGVGNPRAFFDQLRASKFDVVSTRKFADHHVYTQSDIIAIEKQARDDHAELLVTTAKDAVKLKHLNFTLPCFVVEIEVVIDNAEEFDAML
jgi:tetraacyldisaccharide 4'-kinase